MHVLIKSRVPENTKLHFVMSSLKLVQSRDIAQRIVTFKRLRSLSQRCGACFVFTGLLPNLIKALRMTAVDVILNQHLGWRQHQKLLILRGQTHSVFKIRRVKSNFDNTQT